MSKTARQGSDVDLYHAIVRGSNKTNLFPRKEDFEVFLDILEAARDKFSIKIHHYCLIANHVHLLTEVPDPASLSPFMQKIRRSYHHYYREKYNWFGLLFQGCDRNLPIETETRLLDCGRSVKDNPVRATLVQDPEDWQYFSYKVYACGFYDRDLIGA